MKTEIDRKKAIRFLRKLHTIYHDSFRDTSPLIWEEWGIFISKLECEQTK